jgi:(2Fe-2S) ferredoxin
LERRRFKIFICRGPECGDRRGSKNIAEAFERELRTKGVRDVVELGWQSCFGRCTQGPNALVREVNAAPTEQRFAFATLPTGQRGKSALYNRLTAADAGVIVSEHICRGTPVRRLIEAPTLVRPAPPTHPEETPE